MTNLDVGFNLGPSLLQVLHNGTVDGAAEIRVVVCNCPRFCMQQSQQACTCRDRDHSRSRMR